jgi:hypothetical protein
MVDREGRQKVGRRHSVKPGVENREVASWGLDTERLIKGFNLKPISDVGF